ncbi:glycogen synthase [Aureibaculum marinum]|uniref:starch synthase n=1 Tax=Aureibaculum marinum TaxID=2487930 RepID=A0A3N4NQ03_9FLAO|nr:glycogen/starch synthase [Aureibaculum marinum]RPD96598.1 glycogen synthase [Aureibaculum marinum]
MKDKRILYVSSEVIPYLPETDTASTSFELARQMHGKGAQIRIFMPRFGVINERRHQLHEVIRLSGMNLIINDMDMPLIIKVASIPKERMQVYFIDNDEYFKRKAVYSDEDGKLFEDNDERAIFFAKGVIETVKKLNWTPDIIHVHGWMASLLPLYLREYYKNDPLYINSKIVTSIYDGGFKGTIGDKLVDKIKFDGINDEKLTSLSSSSYNNLLKIAIENSDGVIKGSETIPDELLEFVNQKNIPLLEHPLEEGLTDIYSNFYLTEVL